MRRLSSPTIFLLPLLWTLLPACSQANPDHCGNREGNLACSQQDPATPHCSVCVADNNGCVADRPADSCIATTAPATSTAAPSSSSTVDPTTGASESATSTTSTPTTGQTTDPATGTTTTGQTDTSTTTTPGTTTTTGDTSTDTTDTIDTLDTLETLGTSTTGDTSTTGSTTEGPVCGNNKVEVGEACDGTKLDGESCATVAGGKWDYGTLTCNEGCQSFNDTQCCIDVGNNCGFLGAVCCTPLKCKPGIGKVTCEN